MFRRLWTRAPRTWIEAGGTIGWGSGAFAGIGALDADSGTF